MSIFPKFSHLPLEMQDMIWTFALPGPRVVEYQSSPVATPVDPETPFDPEQPTADSLAPFAPALFSVCRRSRHWASKHYLPICSPIQPSRTIGYLDFSQDTLLLNTVPEDIFGDDPDSGINRAAAQRMDRLLATALGNTHSTWSPLQFLAISVPVFLITLWSGRGGLAREQSSPILNALYDLPALEGIAIVSTGAQELESVRDSATKGGTMVHPSWDQRNVWRFLTENEANAGWAKLLREGLVDNFGLGKEDSDADLDGGQSWDEMRGAVWPGRGPVVVHVGLEIEATRKERRAAQGLPRRSERLRIRREVM